jgi:hypothetical protein
LAITSERTRSGAWTAIHNAVIPPSESPQTCAAGIDSASRIASASRASCAME